jgi:hypothetical protein
VGRDVLNCSGGAERCTELFSGWRWDVLNCSVVKNSKFSNMELSTYLPPDLLTTLSKLIPVTEMLCVFWEYWTVENVYKPSH